MACSSPVHRTRDGAGAISRGLLALVLYTLVLGNQWATERIWQWVSSHPEQSLVITLARVVNFPSWQVFPDERWGSPWRLWFILNLSTLVFLMTTAVLRLSIGAQRPPAGRIRAFLGGLIATVLAALFSQLTFNAATGLLVNGMFFVWADDLGYAAMAGALFGVIVGFLDAVGGKRVSAAGAGGG